MAAITKIKAEERFAEIQKRDKAIKEDIENATKLRLEKTARLRSLRLAKEAEDATAKKQEASGKPAPAKGRSRAPSPRKRRS